MYEAASKAKARTAINETKRVSKGDSREYNVVEKGSGGCYTRPTVMEPTSPRERPTMLRGFAAITRQTTGLDMLEGVKRRSKTQGCS